MRIVTADRRNFDSSSSELPVIEGTAEELVQLATAVTGAVTHQEAVVFHDGEARIGIRLLPGEGSSS